MQPMYYIGLDVHKRKTSYCVKDGSGQIYAEGSISATAHNVTLAPMTYMLNGKQFIVVPTGGANLPAEPIALRLS